MPVPPNTALTPDKKDALILEIKNQIDALTKSLKERKYGDAVYILLQNTKEKLQASLDTLLSKKGITTPAQTNVILEQINESKKARLQTDYIMGIRKSTFTLLSLAVIGVAAYLIIKNRKK